MELAFLFLHGFYVIVLVNTVIGDDPLCPSNIRSCYNCEVEGGCLQTEYVGITEQECLHHLTQENTTWSVEYNYTSGWCRESNCGDIKILYREGKVIHRKTCDTECGNYNIQLIPEHKVVANQVEVLRVTGPKYWECMAHCLSTNTSCTVAYESDSEECVLYTECQDTCPLEGSQVLWSVYTKTCAHTGGTTLQQSTSSKMTTISPSTSKAFQTTPQPTTPQTTTPKTTPTPPTTTPKTTPTPPTTTPKTTPTPPTTTPQTPSPQTTTPQTPSPQTTTPQTPTPQTTTIRSTASLVTTSQTATLVTNRLYIMPCICYQNKTFANMTQEEIIAKLIKDTQIDTKKTALAQSRLISKYDSRTSSVLIGTSGVTVLCSLVGIMLCCDIITFCNKRSNRFRSMQAR